MHLGLVTALVFYPYLPLAKISHISSLMIWWLVVCPSSPLVRVIVLPCSFYYPSLFLQPSLDVASPRPSSQSRAPPGLILMVLSKIHLAAQLRCQRRSLHSTTLQRYNSLLLWKCSSEVLDLKVLWFAYTGSCSKLMQYNDSNNFIIIDYFTDPSLIILFL